MRRNRRGHLRDLFFNTGDLNERTVDESTRISRDYTNSLQEQMLEEERLKMKHKNEEDQMRGPNYPSCDLNDRPQNL